MLFSPRCRLSLSLRASAASRAPSYVHRKSLRSLSSSSFRRTQSTKQSSIRSADDDDDDDLDLDLDNNNSTNLATAMLSIKREPSAAVLDKWRSARAVCFDVDSTLCTDESIDEIAAFLGVGEEVAALTSQLRFVVFCCFFPLFCLFLPRPSLSRARAPL